MLVGNYSGKLGLLCFFVYLLMLFRYRKPFFGPVPDLRNYGFILSLIMLLSVFNFVQYDTYHYAFAYVEMVESGSPVGVEDFYFWLVQVLPKSYLLWRFAVWGSASLLIVMTARRLEINSEMFGFMVALFFLTQFSGTRVSLGFSLMIFCAVAFIQSVDNRKILMTMFSVLGMWGSLYLHKSMFVFVLLLVFALLLPINKKTIKISLILFPFFYVIALVFSQYLLDLGIFNEQQAGFMNRYMGRESGELNATGLAVKFFEKISIILFMYLIAKRLLSDKDKPSKALYFLFKYAYLMMYISFLFLGQKTSIWISMRSLHAGMFALVFCASRCFDLRYTEKRTSLEKVSFLLMAVFPIWEQISFVIKNWN